MKHLSKLLGALALVVGVAASASDQIGVYGQVREVVFEPSASQPERVKVYGTFFLAKPFDVDHQEYTVAKAGYMYFKLSPGKEELARNEWADLQKVAELNAKGTHTCAAFGSRHKSGLTKPFNGTVRTATAPGGAPDSYPIAMGVTRVYADHYLCGQLIPPPPTKSAK